MNVVDLGQDTHITVQWLTAYTGEQKSGNTIGTEQEMVAKWSIYLIKTSLFLGFYSG